MHTVLLHYNNAVLSGVGVPVKKLGTLLVIILLPGYVYIA